MDFLSRLGKVTFDFNRSKLHLHEIRNGINLLHDYRVGRKDGNSTCKASKNEYRVRYERYFSRVQPKGYNLVKSIWWNP